MRAQSKVSTYLQQPATIFGMAGSHFLFVIVITLFLFVVLSELLIGSAGFLAALGFLVVGIGYAMALRRKDAHCETRLLWPVLFYKGAGFPFPLKSNRIFIVGRPLKARKKRKPKK